MLLVFGPPFSSNQGYSQVKNFQLGYRQGSFKGSIAEGFIWLSLLANNC